MVAWVTSALESAGASRRCRWSVSGDTIALVRRIIATGMMGTKREMRYLLLCALALLLFGCSESPETLYLYGPTKHCVMKAVANCDRIKPYDILELKVFPERQEVSFSQAAIGLDSSNTIFKRLENCKVVSEDSFSCDGLTRSDGVFTDSKVFGSRVMSRSYWVYWFSLIDTEKGQKQSTVKWWSDNHRWLTVVIVIFFILLLLGMGSQ